MAEFLIVNKKDNLLELDFPKDTFTQITNWDVIGDAVGLKPIETYKGQINLMACMRMKGYFKSYT